MKLNKDLISLEDWQDITNNVSVYTTVIPNLQVAYAYAKKNYGTTQLKMILKSSTGIPANSNLNACCNINVDKYKPSIGFSTFGRTNDNYDYAIWDGNTENICWLRVANNGEIIVRTKVANQKVVVIDLTY